MSQHLFWDFASGVSDAGCQSGLLVAGSRIKSGQLEAERGIYSNRGEVAHRLTGKDGNKQTKMARSQLAMAKPASRSEHSKDTAAAPQLAWALTTGPLETGFAAAVAVPNLLP